GVFQLCDLFMFLSSVLYVMMYSGIVSTVVNLLLISSIHSDVLLKPTVSAQIFDQKLVNSWISGAPVLLLVFVLFRRLLLLLLLLLWVLLLLLLLLLYFIFIFYLLFLSFVIICRFMCCVIFFKSCNWSISVINYY